MIATILNTTFLIIFIVYLIFVRKKCLNFKNSIEHSYLNLDAYLKKRYDIVPKLVENLRGKLAKEVLLEKIKELVKYDYSILTKTEKLKLNGRITTGLEKLFEACEVSQGLLDDADYINYKKQIDEIQDNIEKAKKNYNHNANEFNKYMQKMPHCFFASLMGFNNEEVFENCSNINKTEN